MSIAEQARGMRYADEQACAQVRELLRADYGPAAVELFGWCLNPLFRSGRHSVSGLCRALELPESTYFAVWQRAAAAHRIEYTNVSPKRLLSHIWIVRSLAVLRSGAASQAEASYYLGYSSPASLQRVVRDHTNGLTVSAWARVQDVGNELSALALALTVAEPVLRAVDHRAHAEQAGAR